MHHPTDRIIHTTAFVTPVMKHWLEREIVSAGKIMVKNTWKEYWMTFPTHENHKTVVRCQRYSFVTPVMEHWLEWEIVSAGKILVKNTWKEYWMTFPTHENHKTVVWCQRHSLLSAWRLNVSCLVAGTSEEQVCDAPQRRAGGWHAHHPPRTPSRSGCGVAPSAPRSTRRRMQLSTSKR